MIDPPLPGASLTSAPSDWQVVQCDADGVADLALTGVHRVNAPNYRVEARLVREADGAPVTTALDWQVAELLPDQAWRLTLRGVPAGGLYRLETRVWRTNCPDVRPTRGDYVHHLAVGDIWLIAGQSNGSGTGLGPALDPPTLGVHLFGNDEVWKLACHPVEDATRTKHPITVHGVFQANSPWLAFGRRLLSVTGRPVGLIPTALGGSPLAMWLPEPRGALLDNALAMLEAAGGKLAGVVWHQGESDCQPGLAESYGERFPHFVTAIREAAGNPDLPILTAQLGRCTSPMEPARHRCWTLLRETQRRLADQLEYVSVVPSIDLPLSDEIHLSAASCVKLGERFADVALRVKFGLDTPDPGITLTGVSWQGTQALRLSFQRPPAGWCRPGEIGDFLVEDEQGEVRLAEVVPDDDGWVELRLAREPVGAVTVHAHPTANARCDLRDRDQRPVYAFSVAAPER